MKTKQTRIGRTLTVAAAVAGVVTAFAQEAPQVTSAPTSTAAPGAPEQTALTKPATTAPEAASTLAWQDREFLQNATTLHASGADLARLAENNAGTEEIQALGDELLAEHTRSLAALREIARMKSVDVTSELSASQQATISAFANKLGQTFDTEYRAQTISNHEQAIRLFSDAAKNARDPEVRGYAERSLGEMKERHAALGGGQVKIKGSVAANLPKPAKSLPPEKAPSKKAATPAATQQAAPAQNPAVAQTQAQPAQLQQSRPRPAPRPMPVSTFVQNFDGTYSIIEPTDPRVTNAYSQGSYSGEAYSQATTTVPTAQIPTTSDPRDLWRAPREMGREDRRLARQPSMNVILAGESPSAPKRTTRPDTTLASAPVARVAAPNDTPRQVVTRTVQEPVSSDRPVITVRRAPAQRIFRIFDNDGD